MAPDFLGGAAKGALGSLGIGGGVSVPGFTSSSSANSAATGGTNLSPWYQGDIVVAGEDANNGALPAAIASATSSPALLIAAAVVLGVVLWRRRSK